MKKSLLLLLMGGLFSSLTFAQLLNVELDLVASHDAPFADGVDLTGYNTYQLFAVLEGQNDFVSSVFGLQTQPVVISTTTSFWQSDFGANIGANINQATIGLAPSVEFDSWITIGRENSSVPGSAVQAVESDQEPWLTNFAAGGDIEMDGVFGGSWFTLFSAEAVNAYPDQDGRVLLGQFTTDGDIIGFINVQVFLGGVQSNAVVYQGFAFTSIEGAVLGCTDEEATNFDPDATVNDGSCVFPCVLEITVNVNQPLCPNSSSGSAQIVATGAQSGVFFSLNNGNLTANANFNNLTPGFYTIEAIDGAGCSVEQVFEVALPEPIVVMATVSQGISCNGAGDGIISIETMGGTGGYTYSLDAGFENSSDEPVFTDLGPGSYVVYVNDENGCAAQSSTVSLTQPIAISGSVTFTQGATCSDSPDGVIVVQFTGGAGGLNYSVDGETFDLPNVINIVPGAYTVYAQDANGCVAEASNQAVVGGPDAITALTEITSPSCVGDGDGSVVVGAEGGNGGFVFTFGGDSSDDEITLVDLAAAVYTVEVVDEQGCEATFEIEITDPAAIEAFATGSSVSCFGDDNGTIEVTAAGGTGSFSFVLEDGDAVESNIFEGLAPGSYDIMIFDENGCTVMVDAIIGEPAELTVQGGASEESESGAGDASIEIIVSGGTEPYTFEWSGPNGFTSGVQNPANVSEGSYTAVITDANGCEVSFSTDVTVSIMELGNGVLFSVYPNPTNGVLYLEIEGLEGDRVQYAIIDGAGRFVDRVELNAGRTQYREAIDMTYLASGLYMIQLTVGDYTTSVRVMKQN